MSRQPINRDPMTRERPILLGFVVQRKGIDGRTEISFRWRRFIGTFSLLAVLGWFALAGALYFHFKYNKEFDQVSYTKMLTLMRFALETHLVKMGN